MRRTSLAATLAIAAALAAPASAAAWGDPVPPGERLSGQPFAPWGDTNAYWLLPGGDFEGGLGDWLVNRRSHIVPDSRDDGAGNANGVGALLVRPYATAISRTVSLVDGESVIRFFARTARYGGGSLHVSVSVTSPDTGDSTTVETDFQPDPTWGPSDPITLPTMYGSDGTEQVEVQISSTGWSTYVVDDVSVDPYKSR